MESWQAELLQVSVWVLPVIFAVTLHEIAHGYAALYFGDNTAKRMGRLSLNPLRHVDMMGTVLLPGMLWLSGAPIFGYAKPVPVDFGALNRPKRDMIWVALAGPGTNVLLALACATALHLVPLVPPMAASWVADNLVNATQINLVLAVFNMLPLPPLDGGRVAVGLLPMPLALRLARLERMGIGLVMAGLFLLPWLGEKMGMDLDLFGWLLGPPVEWLFSAVVALAGVQ